MTMLLAAVLLVQDKAAQEAFKNIEQALEAATSLEMTYRLEGRFEEATATFTTEGIVRLKGKSMVSASRRTTFTNGVTVNESTDRMSCDGARLSLEFLGRKSLSGVDPKVPLVARFKCGLLRIGATSTIGLGTPPDEGDPKHPGGLLPKEEFHISDLREGPKGERGKTLEYVVRYDDSTNPGTLTKPAQVALEYDPATWKILGRTVIWDGRHKVRTKETYEFTLNADIPDEKFKIPEDKR